MTNLNWLWISWTSLRWESWLNYWEIKSIHTLGSSYKLAPPHHKKDEWTCIISHTSIGLSVLEWVSSHVALYCNGSQDFEILCSRGTKPEYIDEGLQDCEQPLSIIMNIHPHPSGFVAAMGGHFWQWDLFGWVQTQNTHALSDLLSDGWFPRCIKRWSQSVKPPT